MNKKTVKKIIMSVIVGTAISFLIFYLFLPPITPLAPGFWVYLAVVFAAYLSPFLFSGKTVRFQSEIGENDDFDSIERLKEILGVHPKKKGAKKSSGKVTKNAAVRWIRSKPILFSVICLPIVIVILAKVFSMPLFHARSYASIIQVENGDFAEDMPETTEITNIALMDSDSAAILGNRTLGSLSHVVSQYTIHETYLQINYRGTPQKVAPLEYDGFFKWLNNKKSGVPGMVMVDPVKSIASYIEFKKPMTYVESAYFGQRLERKLRFDYPTKIFHHVGFEVDDEGNPFYVVACAKPRVLLGALDIDEVILFNPCDGTSKLYAIDETPSWVDVVYTGNLACEKYNWYGTLSGGYINSMIGNKGCKQTTQHFGYIVIDDDVWYFTGVTSVSQDKSNIGFILSNARTGEYKYYPVNGAEEHSAMSAAQGEVQEKGYVASFPSLINYAGEATYIMVLKDDAGLVKLYALVNVENYSIVATGATQAETMNNYRKLLAQNGITSDTEDDLETTVTVSEVRVAMLGGTTFVYLVADDGNVYRGELASDESLILLRAGDKVTIRYYKTEIENLFAIGSYRRVTEGS